MERWDRIGRLVVITVCEYECYALVTSRVPTVSMLCRRFPPLRHLLEAAWGLHL